MKCPGCGLVDNQCRVIDSRAWKHTIRRRRLCSQCGYKWTTYEATEVEFFSDRNRNKYLSWSSREEETLVRLKEQGFSNTAIANKLGRSRMSVTRKLEKLVCSEDYFTILEDLRKCAK